MVYRAVHLWGGVCCARLGFTDFKILDFCWSVQNAQKFCQIDQREVKSGVK